MVLSCEEDGQDAHVRRDPVLYGTKRVSTASAAPWQVILNGADGLDFQTLADCGIFYLVNKDGCSASIGSVGVERRRAIGRRINEILRLPP